MSSKRQRDARTAFEQEFQEQEKQKQLEAEAPIRAQLRENALLQQEIADQEKAIARQNLFSKPSERLGANCTKYTGNLSAEVVTQKIGEAVNAMKLSLSEHGVELTSTGLSRLAHVLNINGQVDSTSAQNLTFIVEYMDSIGAFNQTDVIRTVIERPVEQAPKAARTQEDIERELDALSAVTDTPTVRRKRMELRQELHVMEVMESGIFGEFCRFIREHYDTPFGPDEQAMFTEWLVRNDLVMNAANLNKYRVHRGFLTPDEALAATIDHHSETPIDSYHTRRDLSQRIKSLATQ
jgi:hypothetical protein